MMCRGMGESRAQPHQGVWYLYGTEPGFGVRVFFVAAKSRDHFRREINDYSSNTLGEDLCHQAQDTLTPEYSTLNAITFMKRTTIAYSQKLAMSRNFSSMQ